MPGHLDLIYLEVNNATRSTRARIQLPNPDGSLLAGMYTDVAIATGTPVIAFPDDAVIDTFWDEAIRILTFFDALQKSWLRPTMAAFMVLTWAVAIIWTVICSKRVVPSHTAPGWIGIGRSKSPTFERPPFVFGSIRVEGHWFPRGIATL